MNLSARKIILGLWLGVLTVCCNGPVLVAMKSKQEILEAVKKASANNPCLFFESYGTFPHAIVYNPMKNEIKDIHFACDTDGVAFVKTAEDFENLIPAKIKKSNTTTGIFTEKKYKGWVADKPFVKALTQDDYSAQFKKPFIVSEYESGMSMKWVFETAEQFQGFKKYFLNNIQTPASQKPFLVIEIEKNPEALTDEDATFLSEYFNVADVSDPKDKKQAKELDKTIMQALHDVADLIGEKAQVGKTVRDMVIEDIETGYYGGFDSKKVKKQIIMWVIAAIVVGVPLFTLYTFMDIKGLNLDTFKAWLKRKIEGVDMEAELEKVKKRVRLDTENSSWLRYISINGSQEEKAKFRAFAHNKYSIDIP